MSDVVPAIGSAVQERSADADSSAIPSGRQGKAQRWWNGSGARGPRGLPDVDPCGTEALEAGVLLVAGDARAKMVEMSDDAQAHDLIDLLSRAFSVDKGNGGPHYRHVVAPPLQDGAVDVPEIMVQVLTITDGVALFSSDDEMLQEIGAPPYTAVLYDRHEIELHTNDLREQVLEQLQSLHADDELTAERWSALSAEVSQFWVIGATVTGDSFVIESKTATSIRIWPHETLVAPFFDPDEAPRVDGLEGLVAWLEARLR